LPEVTEEKPWTNLSQHGRTLGGGTALIKELHKLINAIWRKEELPKE